MALRGLAIPVMPGPDGRAMMVEDEDEQLAKIIAVGLSDCTSNNPYQNLGMPNAVVFDLNDDTTRGRVYEYLERFFARLQREGRAKLTSVEVEDEPADSGEMVLVVRYTNIKTRSPKAVSFGMGRTGTARVLEVV